MIRRLFIDIETSPCIGTYWRPGYNVTINPQNTRVQGRIITLAYKWQHKDKIKHLAWGPLKNGRPFTQDDYLLVLNATSVMNEADEIIAHYGDGFDVPWIRTRALYHGIITGVWKTVDTKAWASKYFILPSNKLDYIAQYLGIGEKIRTEYDLWDAITFDDCQESLDKMVKYNIHDVELLQAVWEYLRKYVPPPTHAGVHEGKAKWTCPECGGEPKRRQRPMTSATGVVKHQMYCSACPRYYMINNASYQKWIDP